MTSTQKALIIISVTALAVVLALARREPPPRLVGVRGTENQADQAEPERKAAGLALVKNEEREEAIA